MLDIIIFLIGSYIIGSLSPAYLLGRLTVKKDLRKIGTKNLGASNVFLNISKTFGVITGIFDILKGAIVVYLSIFFGFNYIIAYLAILLVIIGHIFPFYLNFKGGKGVATSLGVIIALFIFGKSLPYFRIILTILVLYNLFMQYYRTSLELKEIRYRKLYRLSSVIIPIVYLLTTKKIILILITIALAIYLIIDITRLFSKNLNKTIFSKIGVILKKKEKRNISTSTWFILSSLITILLFQKDIAILSITIFIFADSFSELYGKRFGTIKLIGERSLQGSIAYLASATLISLLMFNFITLENKLFILAPIISTLAEQITIELDDNLTVSIITALVLSII